MRAVLLVLTAGLLCGGTRLLPVAEAAGPERYLWMVTLDGLRGEEVFAGPEARLFDKDIGGVENPDRLRAKFWHDDPEVRRSRLMPFLWSEIASNGQIFGSIEAGSTVTVRNGKYFSYPGYQEILCGFPDDEVDSNNKRNNKNETVLEWLAGQPSIDGSVAAFASWDVFPYIINSDRNGIYVNAGWQRFDRASSETTLQLLNRAVLETPHYWGGARFDFLTFMGAVEYLKTEEPSVLYLALDETDDWCHSGRYDLYLDAARRCDGYLKELWEYAQQSEKYRGKTSMIITTDHGRGGGREGWKNHGADLPGSEWIWAAAIGPDIPALGVRENVAATQGQYASSSAALMGFSSFWRDSDKIPPPFLGLIEPQSGATGGEVEQEPPGLSAR